MLLKELRNYFQEKLSPIYEKEEVTAFFYWLAEEYLHIKKSELVFRLHEEIKSPLWEKFNDAVKRLQYHEPIQYIIGKTEFMGLEFALSPAVLIPRPETEEMVAWILDEVKELPTNGLRILDIGTGSGCIAISLAKKIPHSGVFALDISEEALEMARKNAIHNKVDVHFIQADILKNFPGNETFDIIVSNPPYVTPLEKKWMSDNVLHYEPHTALFVPEENPLLFYKAIASLGKRILKPGGNLYFEINEAYGTAITEFLSHLAYRDIFLKKDFLGKNRMIKTTR